MVRELRYIYSRGPKRNIRGKIPGLKYSTTSNGSSRAPRKIAITASQIVRKLKLICLGRFVMKSSIPNSA
jgi:hypothetical protein